MDWRPPSGSALARIGDLRVRQFWDPKHMVAAELNRAAKSKPPQPEPDCCMEKGYYWDEAILYAPREQWKDAPASAFWNGPVAQIIPGLEKALAGAP